MSRFGRIAICFAILALLWEAWPWAVLISIIVNSSRHWVDIWDFPETTLLYGAHLLSVTVAIVLLVMMLWRHRKQP